MKFINQTVFNFNGNCLEACLASILHLKLDQVPSFSKNSWHKECNEWLQLFGLGLITVNVCKKGMKILFETFKGYVIGVGTRKGSNGVDHAVILYEGKIIHDPMPKNKELDMDIHQLDLIVVNGMAAVKMKGESKDD
jgi:hypothetical protein